MLDVFQLYNLDVIHRVRKQYVESGLSYGWKANTQKIYDQGHWNKQILANSKRLPYDNAPLLDNHNDIKILWKLLQQKIGSRGLYKVYINGYTFGTDGYAHQDDPWISDRFGDQALSETVIIYLNPTWDIDWAGETVVYENLSHNDNNIVKSVLPKLGRAFVFDSSKYHASRPLSRICPALRSIIVFKTIDQKVIHPAVKFITDVTPKISHSGRTFFEHLIGTMVLLENRAKPVTDDVLLAGLYHSIYGTEYFEYKNSEINRDLVKDLIGQYAEQLAYEFCNMKDRVGTMLTNSNQYSQQMLSDLITIEICNLYDQNSLGTYNSDIQQLQNKLSSME